VVVGLVTGTVVSGAVEVVVVVVVDVVDVVVNAHSGTISQFPL
jgi:hypothetical protein